MDGKPQYAQGDMNVLQAIRERRAVRDFTSQPVPQASLRQVISAASWAPSAMNAQPWHFTVVTDKAILDEISTRAKAWMLANMPEMHQSGHFRDLLADPSFHLFYRAPALVVISVPAGLQWATEDCALAAQNLMLAAADLGLGTCWIGFAQGWLTSQEGRELLNLAPERVVVAPIAVGYPKASQPIVPRKAIALSWIGPKDIQDQSDTHPVH
jgi:nitroreductase